MKRSVKHLHKKILWSMKGILFAILPLCFPINSKAYFGTNEDYILSEEKPEGRIVNHYLEFTNEETYTVVPGDTLWDIAEDYWGDGAYYQQIFTDNSDTISKSDLLIPGMELTLKKTLYTGAGISDYIDEQTFRGKLNGGLCAFNDASASPYQIFPTCPYQNDLQEADPYTNWEEFQKEVSRCSREVCGDLVSELSFERYRATGNVSLCSYSFTFDAGDREYIVIACFCYNSTTKSEAFALCDKEYCTEEQLKEAKGKTFYAAVRYLQPGMYYAKTGDYLGAEDWKYPQIRNPFASAMYILYTGPLPQAEDYPNDHVISWKEPAIEELVREELAALWQLTPEEKQAFMERDITAGDLSLIKTLAIRYYPKNSEEEALLCVQLNGCRENGHWGADARAARFEEPELLTTLEDLKNFPKLEELGILLNDSGITDLSCIGELSNLRVLGCSVFSEEERVESLDFLGNLVNLRDLSLDGVSMASITRFFNDVTDLSMLRNCPHLAYLTVFAGNVENFDFLRELPEIYYIRVESGGDCQNIVPDKALLPNACFIEFYGDQVRFEVGDGYEHG